MDPAMLGEGCDTSAMFRTFDGPEAAADHLRRWEGFSVEERQYCEMVQTDW